MKQIYKATGRAAISVIALLLTISGFGVAQAQIIDDFTRADSAAVGGGWIEKTPAAFTLQGNAVAKQAVSAEYRDLIVYRPASENLQDVEVSLEFRLTTPAPGYPQLFARVQTATVATPNVLDGYILYIDNSATAAVLARQSGSSFVTALANIAISPGLNTTDTYRMRLRTTGTSPVQLAAFIERQNGASWDVIGQAAADDASAARFSAAGSVGFGGYVEAAYTYDNFFRADLGGGGGGNPLPLLNAINPTSATEGGSAFSLTVQGNNFTADSVVRWNGADRTTTFVSAGELQAAITAADIANSGSAQVTVFTPAPGGGTSTAQTFTIDPLNPGNPLPVLTAINPTSATEGGSAFSLTVQGSDFTVDSVVRWNGADRTTTFVSAGELQAAITAADIANSGSAQVTVFTPAPGGGTSAAQAFAIDSSGPTNPTPVLGGLTPSSAVQGSSDLSVTLQGSGFVPTSVARWNGADRPTTYVSSISLQVNISAADLASLGTSAITVVNPAPGGGESDPESFAVLATGEFLDNFDRANNPDPQNGWTEKTPAVFQLLNNRLQKNTASTTYLDNVMYRSVAEQVLDSEVSVEFDISNTVVGYPQLWTRLSTDTVATPGTLDGYILYIDNAVNQAVLGRQNGAGGFAVLATLNFNEAMTTLGRYRLRLTTSGTSPVQISAYVESLTATGYQQIAQAAVNDTSAQRIQLAGISGVGGDFGQAFSYDNFRSRDIGGGGGSNPLPVLSTINPSSTQEGAAAFLLTVQGGNFTADSVVRWNGADRTTTFVSSVELQAAITAADVASSGSAQVTVFTPAPGGGISAAQTFTIDSSTPNPAPVLNSINPNSVTEGASAFSLTVLGSDFSANSVVRWNGADRVTTFVSATELQAAITTADVASSGSAQVTVFTPAPGGGTSGSRAFTIDSANIAGNIDSLSPESQTSGSAGITLDINGSGFTNQSVVRWNGADRTTIYVSPQLLQATIPAGDLAATQVVTVNVVTPGLGSTAPFPFFVTEPGSSYFFDHFNRGTSEDIGNQWTEKNPAAFSMENNAITGIETPFNVVYRDNIVYRPAAEDRRDVELSVEFVRQDDASLAQLHARAQRNTITNTDTLESYIFYVEDFYTPPGGMAFAINSAGQGIGECIIRVVPFAAPLVIGERYRMRFRVTGSYPVQLDGYLDRWDGSAWQSIIADTVIHDNSTPPDPYFCGTGTMPPPLSTSGSNGFSKWFNTPEVYDNYYWLDLDSGPDVPVVSTLSPTSALAGSAAFTLDISGNNFAADSVVRWNGADRTTTFVNPNLLQASISAADIASVGTAAVTVFSPAGGLSNSVDFDITSTQSNPVPTLASLSPMSALQGTSGLQVTVQGSNFVPASVVRWNGSDRVTTYVSPTSLLADITTADLSLVGSGSVTVVNPSPGGGQSGQVSFAILAAGEFVDDFNRADNTDPQNGWIEKSAAAYQIAGNELQKAPTSTGYLDNLLYRPQGEQSIDTETSVEMTLNSTAIGFPQIWSRLQPGTVGSPGTAEGYILYMANSLTTASLGRQNGATSFVTLATINLSESLNTTDRYRLRLRTTGTNPVNIEAYIERLETSSYQIIGQATVNDSAAERFQLVGANGISAHVEQSYSYDNFRSRNITP